MTANPKDLLSGAFFILFGIAAYAVNSSYRFGHPSDIGPGFFPTILAVILVAIGLAIAVKSFVSSVSEPLPPINWRGIVGTMGGVAAFGLSLRPLGLVPAVILLCIISQAGSGNARWLSGLAFAVGLAAASAAIFHYGLGVPMQPFGTWLR